MIQNSPKLKDWNFLKEQINTFIQFSLIITWLGQISYQLSKME